LGIYIPDTRKPMKTQVHFSSATDMWETPQSLFDELNLEFAFTCDVCSTDENKKCEYHFTPKDDGLAMLWGGVCWMNPPYGREIGKWMRKAYESRLTATVVCLVPARTDTAWWWDYAMRGEIRFIRGRLKFGGHSNSAPFPSAIVIFHKESDCASTI